MVTKVRSLNFKLKETYHVLKSIIIVRFTSPRFFQPPNGPRSWKKHLLEKRKLAILITQLFLSLARFGSSNFIQLLTAAREAVLLPMPSVTKSTTSLSWNVRKTLWLIYSYTDLHLIHWHFTALQDKFVTVICGGHRCGDSLRFTKTSCHLIRTQVVSDFTAARVNDSAWAGAVVLEENNMPSLAKTSWRPSCSHQLIQQKPARMSWFMLFHKDEF